MDLAKIIAELRTELQCLDTAIASIEELARVQNLSDAGLRPMTPSDSDQDPPEPEPPEPTPQDAAPVKRRRGRPRKQEAAHVEEPQTLGPGSAHSSDDSSASAA